jgi:hypothetical protein
MLSVHVGHDPDYLTKQVGTGRENYYLKATTSGEPPGRWWGRGAAGFGLAGEVDADQMKALYTDFSDPRDPRWADPQTRAQCEKLGRTPQEFKTTDEIFRGLLAKAKGTMTPERRNELWSKAERMTRQSVAFIDCTFSPVKSFTLGHLACARMELEAQRAGDEAGAAEWARYRRAFEEALWVGNRAMLEYLADHAGYSRVGRHTAKLPGRWIDGHDWTVASFFQHTSRENDPQLHIHNAVLNRVVCSDGQVRTLDSKAIHRLKQGSGTVGEVAMMHHLTKTIGARWKERADGIAWELVGVDKQAMDLFSTRTARMTAPLRRMVEDFTRRNGRAPVPIEVDHMRRAAAMSTRKAKSSQGETAEQELDRWEDQVAQKVAGGLARIAANVRAAARAATGSGDQVGRDQGMGTTGSVTGSARFSPQGVMAEAVAKCQAASPSWGRSELTRQLLLSLLQATGGDLSSDQVGRVADLMADRVMRSRDRVVQVAGRQPTRSVPEAFRVASGRSSYLAPAGSRYATRDQIIAEQALRRAASHHSGASVDEVDFDLWATGDPMGQRLTVDQAAAVRGLLTCPALVSVLVGPAGTGKSFTMGTAAKAWTELVGGRMIGLATSQIATQVLGEEMSEAVNAGRVQALADDGITDAMNISRWLAAQRRLREPGPNSHDTRWRLSPTDVVVVDEASMVSTAELREIEGYVREAGARMILTGDPRQLGAVGAGGAMAMLADGVARTYHLSEVRRFDRPWERTASLRLREGDTMAAQEYARRGQLMDCGTIEAAAIDAAMSYVADTLRQFETIIITTSNEEAARTSMIVREQMVSLGRVETHGTLLGRDGTIAGVGDVVQARRNRWNLGPSGVVNRQRYTVTERCDDGSLVVCPLDQPGTSITLPPEYVAEHVSLGYASTAHAAQGMTVDTCHAIVAHGMSPEALYVAMTRGRRRNTAHVATHPEAPGEYTGETHGRERMPVEQVMATILDRDRSATEAALVQLANDVRNARSMATIQQRFEDAIRYVGRHRLDQWLDDLAAVGTITGQERQRFAGDDATEQVARLLRVCEQAGHDPSEVLASAITERDLDGARSLAQVIHHRITERVGKRPVPLHEHIGEAIPQGLPAEWQHYLDELGDAADNRRRELAAECMENPPTWAVDALGPVPDDIVGRADWEHRAGLVAAYREAVGWDDQAQAIGPAPTVDDGDDGQTMSPGIASTERRAAWHAAWSALGRPEATIEEQALSEGQLRVRVRAWQRELGWAQDHSPNVDDQLRRAGTEAVKHRRDATLLAAKAETEPDQVQAARMRAEAEILSAKADLLDQVEQDLSTLAEQRAAWYLESAPTREAAERAEAELDRREIPIDAEPDRVTAQEWLRLHDEANRAEDPHRQVSEADVRDPDEVDQAETQPTPVVQGGAGHGVDRDGPVTSGVDQSTPGQDGMVYGTEDDPEQERREAIRQIAAQRLRTQEQLPTPSETAAAVTKARAVQEEIASRRAAEQLQRLVEAEAMAEQVSRDEAAARVGARVAAEEARLRDQALQARRAEEARAPGSASIGG